MANKKKNEQKLSAHIPILQPDSAGIDIGSTEIFIAVPNERSSKPVRKFGTFTDDLHDAAKWLKQCGIKSIAMESTGV